MKLSPAITHVKLRKMYVLRFFAEGSLRLNQLFRVLYVYAVVLVTLFVMAFLWLVLYAVVVPLQAGINSIMAQYDVANSSYQSYELANTFMTNLWAYLLVLVVLGLAYWIYIYSQRREVVYQ